MIALGCKYLRICHLNTCAVGVATQNERLRKEHYIGLPEMVMHYFQFVAEETRELMAQLGVKRLQDLVGRLDLLEVIDGATKKQRQLDFSKLLSDGGVSKDKPQVNNGQRNQPWDKGEQAEEMVTSVLPAIEAKAGGTFHFHLKIPVVLLVRVCRVKSLSVMATTV